MCVFTQIIEGLPAQKAEPPTIMIDATYLKAHRTASSLGLKGDLRRQIGRTKGGMNPKLHAMSDANGRPLSFFITAGQASDYIGAAALLDDLPKAKWMLANRGYDADSLRDSLEQEVIKPCIPGRKSRSLRAKSDQRHYKQCNRIEIMFDHLKDWRRVATRYDRCQTVYFSALPLAATVLFWL